MSVERIVILDPKQRTVKVTLFDGNLVVVRGNPQFLRTPAAGPAINAAIGSAVMSDLVRRQARAICVN
jgi:hypothetical protein